MNKRRFKFITAVVLSMMLVFTMVPGAAFADDGDVTIKVTIKNDTFTQPLKDMYDSSSTVNPLWTGVLINNMNVTVPKDGKVGDAIVDKLGSSNIVMYDGYISSVFDLGWSAVGRGWAGWMYSYNGGEAYRADGVQAGINELINDPDTTGCAIKNGDAITLGYTIDFETIDQPYISIPKNVSAVKQSYNSNMIKWQGYGPTVYNDTGYDIYRSVKKTSDFEKIATITSKAIDVSYTDSSLKTGTTYYYKVEMVKSADKSESSKVVSATPKLSKPSIKVTKKGKKSLKISWKKINGAEKYQIYRATKKNGKYKKIKTVTAKKLSYTNKNLKKGKKYYYKVRAVRKVDKKNVYSAFSAKKFKKR